MKVILNVRTVLLYYCARMQNWLRDNKLDYTIPKEDLTRFPVVIKSLLEFLLYRQSQWHTAYEPELDELAIKIHPWLEYQDNSSELVNSLTELLAHARNDIIKQLPPSSLIPNWDVWSISEMGDTLIIISHGDYRIIQYDINSKGVDAHELQSAWRGSVDEIPWSLKG